MKNLRFAVLLLVCLASAVGLLRAWGVWGHKHINHAAVFALPDPMLRKFFYNHIDFVTEESVVPDIRKYTINDKKENPRHYIDLEAFGNADSIPTLPKDAYKQYADTFLQRQGILPWYIQDMMDKLTKAFKEKKKTEILFLAADLGHYIGDAHMPLHTSTNHDGQLTNQQGIHAFWESQLPERFGDAYNFYTGDAQYIPDVTQETWRIIRDTHKLADTLLIADRELKQTFPKDKIYKTDDKGNVIKNKFNQPIHTDEYAVAFHQKLKGMVEKQLRKSIQATANYWYTAWVNAGKPDLSSLDDAALTKLNAKQLSKDLKAWKKGKLTYMQIQNEF